MELKVDFDGLERSPALIEHAQEKFAHVAEVFGHFPPPLSARLMIMQDRNTYIAELELKAARFDGFYKRSGFDVYAIVNEVMDIAFQEADKHKERLIDDRRKEDARPD